MYNAHRFPQKFGQEVCITHSKNGIMWITNVIYTCNLKLALLATEYKVIVFIEIHKIYYESVYVLQDQIEILELKT